MKTLQNHTPNSVENKPRLVIAINPPPDDGRCECCGRPTSKLPPFDAGEFAGALLVKTFRSMAPTNALAGMVTPDVLVPGGGIDDDKFVAKYGKEKADRFYFAEQLACSVSPSWECRDCIALTEEEYFEKRDAPSQSPPNGGAPA